MPIAEELELVMVRLSGAAEGFDQAMEGSVRIACPPDVAEVLILPRFGRVTQVCAFYLWRRPSRAAVFVAALVGGLADLGYFIFWDLGGFVNFIPGTLMTLFSSCAIALSVTAYLKGAPSAGERHA